MSVTLQVLEAALQPIEQVGRKELTFPLNGTLITLHMPLPEEEAEAQRWAAELLEDEADAPVSMYIERLKVGMLSHAIVQVGDLDLRGVQSIETGDTLPNGVPISKERHRVLRDMVFKWTGLLRTAVWRKMIELSEQVEQEVFSAIEFQPSDPQAEIDRLEARLKELKDGREEESLKLSERLRRLDQPVKVEPAPETQGTPEPQQPSVDLSDLEKEEPDEESAVAPLTPSQVTPRLQRPVPPPVVAPPVRTQALDRDLPARTPPKQDPQRPMYEADDSFVDQSDHESLHAAYEAESRRIMEMRRAQQQQRQKQQQQHSAITRRRPPHVDALEVSDDLAGALQNGEINGIPVYEMPVQSLDSTAPEARPVTPNMDRPSAGSQNPRFRKSQ